MCFLNMHDLLAHLSELSSYLPAILITLGVAALVELRRRLHLFALRGKGRPLPPRSLLTPATSNPSTCRLYAIPRNAGMRKPAYATFARTQYGKSGSRKKYCSLYRSRMSFESRDWSAL